MLKIKSHSTVDTWGKTEKFVLSFTLALLQPMLNL